MCIDQGNRRSRSLLTYPAYVQKPFQSGKTALLLPTAYRSSFESIQKVHDALIVASSAFRTALHNPQIACGECPGFDGKNRLGIEVGGLYRDMT
jgi:hypothetical protein